MKVIYKYAFAIQDDFKINLPIPHQVLDVQIQNGTAVMWVLHNTDDIRRPTQFYLFGTGNSINVNMEHCTHVGTLQDGPFVWHVFESDL